MGDNKCVIPIILGILVLGFFGLSQEVFAVEPKLYSISVNTDQLYTINPNTGNSISSVTITLSGEVVKGGTGLATHPITSELYAILKIDPDPGDNRVLVKINPDTGVATDIGSLSSRFASISFNESGILFGITGWGDPVDNKSLYIINITNGVASRICAIGTGNFGETLAFRTVDNLFYHGSGESNVFFDKFDSDLLNCNTTLINQNLNGLPELYGEAGALTWWPSQNAFLRAAGEPLNGAFGGPYYLWKVPPNGNKPTLLGELDHKSKGLVLQVNGQTETLYSISPFDSQFRTINPNTGATIDDNPTINLNAMIANGTALAQNSTGTIFALVKPGTGGGGPRTLVTLTETIPGTLWTANAIAQSNQRFSGLAFNSDDNLFGVSGEAPQSDSLESIYQISPTNGTETRKCGMGYGGFGEAIGFNPSDGLMYRESGTEDKSFEKFDPTTHDCSTITTINLSDSTIGEPRALVYWPSQDAFIWSEIKGNSQNPAPDILHKVLPDGTVTPIGTLDHDTKGLAFEFIDNCLPPGEGDWTVIVSCEMSTNATVNGNLILQQSRVLTLPSGVVLTVNGFVLVEVLSGIYIVNGGGLNITS